MPEVNKEERRDKRSKNESMVIGVRNFAIKRRRVAVSQVVVNSLLGPGCPCDFTLLASTKILLHCIHPWSSICCSRSSQCQFSEYEPCVNSVMYEPNSTDCSLNSSATLKIC